jgi:acyl-CoA thioester hydrolase
LTSVDDASSEAPVALSAFPYQSLVQTRFADLDPLRHVNNVSIGVLFEEGRVHFHRALFERTPRPGGYVFVLVQANYRFLRETFYPDPVEIGLGISRIGRTSFSYAQALFQNGRCTSLCDTILVGLSDRAPAPIPGPLRDVLSTFLVGD